MSEHRLVQLLDPEPEGSLQWRAGVPIATNPFILLELLQAGCVGGAVVLAVMASGLWLMGGGLQPGDVSTVLLTSLACVAAFALAFVVVAFVFFGNRYYAEYHCSYSGVYQQVTRGRDESGRRVPFASRPFPVAGAIKGGRSQDKDLPWEKVDHFVNFASMRSIQLKRGRWHMLRLYTPDAQTHARLAAYLAKILPERGA